MYSVFVPVFQVQCYYVLLMLTLATHSSDNCYRFVLIFLQQAREFQYNVEIIEPNTPWKFDVNKLERYVISILDYSSMILTNQIG